MKRLVLASTALMLGFGTALWVPTVAAADRFTATVSEVCAAFVNNYPDAFPGTTAAEDMVMCEAFVAEEDDPVRLCRTLRDMFGDQQFTHGRCVNYFMYLRSSGRQGE